MFLKTFKNVWLGSKINMQYGAHIFPTLIMHERLQTMQSIYLEI